MKLERGQLSTFKIPGFNSYQKLAIEKFVIQKQDVLVNLPAGSGKSLIYQALPIVFDSIFKEQGHIVNYIPFLSVLHSVYDVSVLPTLRFILALLNLPLTSLNEVTTVTSSTNKYDAPQTSPANSLYKPKTSTNLNEYHS